MRRPLRSTQTFAIALVLGLSLAGCGDEDQPDAAPGPDARTTAPASPMSRGDFNSRMFRAIEKSGSAKVHFVVGEGAQSSVGDGEVKYGKKMSMRMTMTPPRGTSEGPHEVIVVDDTVYVAVGEKYMSMDMESMKQQGMPDLSTALDPSLQSEAFGQAITSFKQAGTAQTIDGVRAVPYAITIDPTKAPDVFGGAVTQPLTFVFFVGPDDLPRKMVYKDTNGQFVANYSDWGTPVDIEAPEADKVMRGMG